MLDDAGFTDAVISASNDLDEYLIDSLKAQGCTVTSWGVGTHMITSKNWPSFGGVYKLAAIMDENGNFVPKIKLSENSEKITNPGNKVIHRIYEKETGKIKADLIALADETFREDEAILLFESAGALEENPSARRKLHAPRADDPCFPGWEMCIHFSQRHGDPGLLSEGTGYSMG